MSWGFYGRSAELRALRDILLRDRWFFLRITGRRRIGKTSLVQQALRASPGRPVFYVQIPDSALAGYVVALDEFQYFSRKHLFEFTSHLQASVDRLAARADTVKGGLIVLGSLHAELVALLEDRDAPLYNRTTDNLEIEHLDISSLLELLGEHADDDPERLLFPWNLFEGVPKFYRDAFEQSVLASDRATVLSKMFFRSSSPLRTEADNWFLSGDHRYSPNQRPAAAAMT